MDMNRYQPFRMKRRFTDTNFVVDQIRDITPAHGQLILSNVAYTGVILPKKVNSSRAGLLKLFASVR